MNCRRFAYRTSGYVHHKPGASSWFGFLLHWVVCPFCRRYRSELKMIRDEAKVWAATAAPHSVDVADVKARLRERIQKETGL